MWAIKAIEEVGLQALALALFVGIIAVVGLVLNPRKRRRIRRQIKRWL